MQIMKTKYSLFFALCLIFSSCANIVVNYGNPTSNSGNLVIKTTSPVYANLTVNDSLLIGQKYMSGKYVRRITIKNVPEGINSIHFSADSYNLNEAMDKKIEVNVKSGKTNTQLLTVPPRSNGYWVSQTLISIGCIVLLLAIK